MSDDFARIRKNVELMASKGAPPEHINGYLAQEGFTPDKFKARVEGMDAGRIASMTRYSAGSGPANLLDLPGRTVTAAANLATMAGGIIGNKLFGTKLPDTIPPDQLDIFNPLFRKAGIINDDYAPTDGLGKVLDFTTQSITGGGVNPASILRNAQRGLVKPIIRDVTAATASGAGAGAGSALSEGVDTGNKTLDTGARIAATLLGGAVPGGAVAARGTAGDRASVAVKGVTPEQMAIARELKRKAAKQGSPITDYEAIQGVTGLNPKMQTQQRLAEQSDTGATTLIPIMQNRPKANSVMFNSAVDSIAPLDPTPDVLAGKLQAASQGAITAARKAGNEKAAPFYSNSSNNPANRVPSQTWNMLLSDDGVAAALDAVKRDPYRGLQHSQEGSLQWVDQAKRYLDGKISEAKQGGNNDRAMVLSGAREKLVSAADTAFPDYAKARSIVAQNMQENVIPLEQGQVGKLSRSDEFAKQSQALLPDQPADVTPSVVARTADTIGQQDPDILKRFLAQDLRRKFSEANQRNMGGENVFGGPKFAANVAGNVDQEANLIEAIKASGGKTEPFQDAISIFRAQGYKPSANSATMPNADEANRLGGTLSAITKPFNAVPRFVDQWRNGMATSDLAKALAAQDETGPLRIEELARVNGVHDPMKQQMLINLLLANPQNQ